jgi:hypothetical protein
LVVVPLGWLRRCMQLGRRLCTSLGFHEYMYVFSLV